MSKLNEIRDRIQMFSVEDHYEPNDMIRLLSILEAMLEEMERIDKAANFKEQ